ncbi:MAG: RHS repeat-associated core domain-containing protein, partial [Leptospiraceae bacterium]|nr:RHS repeat-associated core domain-containing protein [Leptospiraceae bacterium]
KDNFPFAAFTSVISPDTPSVNDAQSNNDGSGGGGGSANAPIEGLYFFHTDHLDSVTMITNTSGEVVAGTSIGSGKSIISYTPYGEIDRDHSGGPDIYRYKYTGQEEDTSASLSAGKETGLYYYKARYYDPKIGRFLEPDSVLQTSSPFGTNQYMYAEGNPVMYNDPSGHEICPQHVTAIAGAATVAVVGGPVGIVAAPFLLPAFGVVPWHYYTGNGGCGSLREGKEKRDWFTMLALASSNQGTEEGHIIASLLAVGLYYQDTTGVLKPTSDLDEASLEHDKEGSRYHTPEAMKANRKWLGRAWSLGSRWNKTYEHDLKSTPRYWGDLRGTVALLTAGTRFYLDLYPMISGTLLFGTANIVNGGIKSLRWGFERIGVQAKFKLTIDSKNFKMSGSYLKIKTPKCLVCKHK